MNILEEVITVSEAADLTGDTVRTIQRRCESGMYKSRLTPKGVYLILRSSVVNKQARQE